MHEHAVVGLHIPKPVPATRGNDSSARLEFGQPVTLLLHTDAHEAKIAAERLRGVVESHSFPRRKKLTVSVGIATFPVDASDPMTLIVRADQALFQARRDALKPAREIEAEVSAIN